MEAYAVSDIGRVRASNQDYWFASPEPVGILPNLFIVADGMGGHQGGEFASGFTVETLAELIAGAEGQSSVAVVRQCIEETNRRLYAKSEEFPHMAGMGTTLVVAWLEGGILYTANVGDSRLYLIREAERPSESIRQITRDHSFVEEMVAEGRIERGSRFYRERKNIITRAIGVAETVRVDFFENPCLPGDVILLCSDGLTNMLPDEEIYEILNRTEGTREQAEELVKEANLRGGKDNITAVLVYPYEGEE